MIFRSVDGIIPGIGLFLSGFSSKKTTQSEMELAIIVMPLLFILFDWYNILLINLNFPVILQYSFQVGWLAALITYAIRIKVNIYFPFLIYLIFSVFLGLLKDATITSVVANLRILLILPLLIFLFASSTTKLTNKSFFYSLFFFLFINLIWHYAVILNSENYFTAFGLDSYYLSRNISVTNGVPIGFYTIDTAGETILRIFGAFASPDKMAYLVLAFIFSSLYVLKIPNKIIEALFLALVGFPLLFIFHVKATWLILWVYIALLILPEKYLKFYLLTFLSVIFGSLALLLLLQIIPRSYLSSSGAIQHLWGLIGPFKADLNFNYFFGNGLGSGGTVGQIANANLVAAVKSEIGGESLIGSLKYQFGLFGLIVVLQFWRTVFSFCKKNYGNKSACILFAAFVTSAYSEVVMSFFQSFCIFTIIVILRHRYKL